MEQCDVGRLLNHPHCSGEQKIISTLSKIEKKYLKTSLPQDSNSTIICNSHFQTFCRRGSDTCANPFNSHKKKMTASKTVTAAFYLTINQGSLLEPVLPNDKLCRNCYNRLQQPTPAAIEDKMDKTHQEEETPLEILNSIRSLLQLSEISLEKYNLEKKETFVRKSIHEVSTGLLTLFGYSELDSNPELKAIINAAKSKIDQSPYPAKVATLSLFASGLKTAEISRTFKVPEATASRAHQVYSEIGPLEEPPKKKGRPLEESVITAVEEFYLQDEVSREMPGMRQSVMVTLPDGTKEKQQQRLLQFTTRELYHHFKEKNPDLKIGLTKFVGLRPGRCKLLSYTGHHQVCCCIYHENIKEKFEGLGIRSYQDYLLELVCSMDNKNCMYRRCNTCKTKTEDFEAKVQQHVSTNKPGLIDTDVTFKEWQQTDREAIRKITMPYEEFLQELTAASQNILKHHFVSQEQSKFFKTIKEQISEDTAIIQGDFAENYVPVYENEIQRVYYDKQGTTIHPFVVYVVEEGKPKTECIVVISDDTIHNSNSFFSFKSRVIQHIMEKFPKVNKIEYFTDGAASQYKNFKTIANIANHRNDYGITAVHNFFASCHGKGACDGVGGTVKRMARVASLKGELIRNPREFLTFVDQNVSGIKAFFVSAEDVENTIKTHGLEERYSTAKKVPGIQQMHRIVVTEDLSRLHLFEVSSDEDHSGFVHLMDLPEPGPEFIEPGEWVAAVYDDNWFFGKVLTANQQEEEYEVSFLQQTGKKRETLSLAFETNPTCVPVSKVLTSLPAPKTNRTGRTVTFPKDIVAEIQAKFSKFKSN